MTNPTESAVPSTDRTVEIENEWIRTSLGHGRENREVRIQPNGAVEIFGSTNPAAYSLAFWRDAGDREAVLRSARRDLHTALENYSAARGYGEVLEYVEDGDDLNGMLLCRAENDAAIAYLDECQFGDLGGLLQALLDEDESTRDAAGDVRTDLPSFGGDEIEELEAFSWDERRILVRMAGCDPGWQIVTRAEWGAI